MPNTVDFSRLILPGAVKARIAARSSSSTLFRAPASADVCSSCFFRGGAIRRVCAVPRESAVRRGSREPELRTNVSNCARTSRAGVKLPFRIAWRRRRAGTPPISAICPSTTLPAGSTTRSKTYIGSTRRPSMGSPTCLIRTRRSRATRRETPAGTVAPGRAPGVTDAGCARAATATVNKYRHSRIIEYVLRERREGPRPPAGSPCYCYCYCYCGRACYLVSISVGGVMRHFTVPGWTRKFHSKEPALLHKLLVVESNPVNKVYTGPPLVCEQFLAVLAQILSGRRGGIGLVAHQTFPENAVEVRGIEAVFGGEVHSLGNLRPVLSVVQRLWQDQGGRRGRQGEFRLVEVRRGSGGKAPRARRSVEDVGHGPGERVVQVHRRETQNLFDGAQEVDGVVRRGDQRALLDVGARDEGDAAVRIDVVAAILRVVFDDEDQSVAGVLAVGDLLNQQAHRIVVVGLLILRNSHVVNGGIEVPGVIVHEAHQTQRGQAAASEVCIELQLPLLKAVIIRKRVVESAEIRIGIRGEGSTRWVSHNRAGCVRVAVQRNGVVGR